MSQNVIRSATGVSLHCKGMANGGIKHDGAYCITENTMKVYPWHIHASIPERSRQCIRKLWIQVIRHHHADCVPSLAIGMSILAYSLELLILAQSNHRYSTLWSNS